MQQVVVVPKSVVYLLFAFAIICDDRKLAGEMSWPGFPPYVQMVSLLFSCFCSRSGDFAPVYAPLPEIPAMFTSPIVHAGRSDIRARAADLIVPSCRSFGMHSDHWHVSVSQSAYKHRSTVVDISTVSPSKIGRIDVFDSGKRQLQLLQLQC